MAAFENVERLRRIAMIYSSVNLDRFIRPSLPSGRTLRIFGGVLGGQVTRHMT
jgi:hypothetical protein